MSQEKVNYNKEQKHNRKKIVKKKKIQHVVGIVAGCALTAALLVWVGFSVYKKYETAQAENVTKLTLDSSALTEYMANLDEE